MAPIPAVRDALNGLVMKGQDFFRSGVIEALGDYKAAYALPALTEIAKLDGPLQDDAVLAIGKIGDKRTLDTLAGLQRTAPRTSQPSIAAAICLLGVNCSSHQGYLVESLRFSDRQPRLPGFAARIATGLASLAVAGTRGGAGAARSTPGRQPRSCPCRDRARARHGRAAQYAGCF